MNAFRKFQFRDQQRGISTLSLLAAVAITGLLLALLGPVLGTAQKLVQRARDGTQKLSRQTTLLDLVQADLLAMIRRPDVPFLVDATGGPALAGYVRRAGGNSQRSVIAVHYLHQPATLTLERRTWSVDWTEESTTGAPERVAFESPTTFPLLEEPPAENSAIAQGVVGWAVLGANTEGGWSADLAAVVSREGTGAATVLIGAAIFDASLLQAWNRAGRPALSGNLVTALAVPTELPAGETLVSHWRRALTAVTVEPWPGAPKDWKQRVELIERITTLP